MFITGLAKCFYIYTLSDIGIQRALTGIHYTHTVVAISTCILTHTFLH